MTRIKPWCLRNKSWHSLLHWWVSFFAYCMSTSTLIWIFILIHAIKTTRHHRLASIMNKLASLFPLWYLMIDTVSYHMYKKNHHVCWVTNCFPISKKTVNIFICLLWSDCGFTIFMHCQQKLIFFFFHLWSGLNLNLNTPVLIKYIN